MNAGIRTTALTALLLACGTLAAQAQGRGKGPPGGVPPGPPHHVPPLFAAAAANNPDVSGLGNQAGAIGLAASERPDGEAPARIEVVADGPDGAVLSVPCGTRRAALEKRLGPFLTSLLMRKDVLRFDEKGRVVAAACRSDGAGAALRRRDRDAEGPGRWHR